jgi:uncharacterized protein (TIGR02246 family)
MKAACLGALGALVLSAAPAVAESPEALTDDAGLLTFIHEMEDALVAFNNGDPEPTLALSSDDLTLMGGAGGVVRGLDQIRPRLAFITAQRAEGEVEVDYISIGADGDLAYTVQIERRLVLAPGATEPEESALRATHILRKESGLWRLVHRQADPLVEVVVPELAPAQ